MKLKRHPILLKTCRSPKQTQSAKVDSQPGDCRCPSCLLQYIHTSPQRYQYLIYRKIVNIDNGLQKDIYSQESHPIVLKTCRSQNEQSAWWLQMPTILLQHTQIPMKILTFHTWFAQDDSQHREVLNSRSFTTLLKTIAPAEQYMQCLSDFTICLPIQVSLSIESLYPGLHTQLNDPTRFMQSPFSQMFGSSTHSLMSATEDIVVDYLCAIYMWSVMWNVYVKYKRKPNKDVLFRHYYNNRECFVIKDTMFMGDVCYQRALCLIFWWTRSNPYETVL